MNATHGNMHHVQGSTEKYSRLANSSVSWYCMICDAVDALLRASEHYDALLRASELDINE
jgi:hypothetical protein